MQTHAKHFVVSVSTVLGRYTCAGISKRVSRPNQCSSNEDLYKLPEQYWKSIRSTCPRLLSYVEPKNVYADRPPQVSVLYQMLYWKYVSVHWFFYKVALSTETQRRVIAEFIELYKFGTCLWRINSKEYHDHGKREAAYKKIARKTERNRTYCP